MSVRREDLLNALYDQLRKAAKLALKSERKDHTLSATALVHEAYLRLGDSFANRRQFYVAAAQTMRRVLIDHARAKNAIKRGGPSSPLPLSDDLPEVAQFEPPLDPDEMLNLDSALSRLEAQDEDAAEVVQMRFFAGLSIEEIAAAKEVSVSTVKRDWKYAKAFLYRELQQKP